MLRATLPRIPMTILFMVLAIIALVGCDEASDSDADGDVIEDQGESVSKTISAKDGGTISLENGTSLSIPAGALAEDTEITVTRPPSGVYAASGPVAAAVLEPDGLTLSSPATLTMPYDPSLKADTDELVVYAASQANELPRSGGEVNPFTAIEAEIDSATGKIEASIEHFSSYNAVLLQMLHLGLAIPGSYLKNGDILYSLTGAVEYRNGSAVPMHVAMKLENGNGDQVIESTLPEDYCTEDWIEGVDIHSYAEFEGFQHLCKGHIFIGARRPNPDPDDATRQLAANAAMDRRFKPYGILAINWSDAVGIVPGGISCVELAEDAWEEAGINIVNVPDALLWPHFQFANTVPVDHITLNTKDAPISIPIIGTIREKDGTYSTKKSGYGMLSVEVESEGTLFEQGKASMEESSHPQALQDLVIWPKEEDIGDTFVFTITISNGNGASLSQKLHVKIEGDEPPDENPCLDYMIFSDQLNGYWGTLSGTANGESFMLDASLMEFAPKGDSWHLDFQSWDPERDFEVVVGNLDMFGMGIMLDDWVYPGATVQIPVPFVLPEGSDVDQSNFYPRVSMTCPVPDEERADIIIPSTDVTGSLVLEVDSLDCRILSFTVNLTGSEELRYPEPHRASCSYTATFTGSLDDYPY